MLPIHITLEPGLSGLRLPGWHLDCLNIHLYTFIEGAASNIGGGGGYLCMNRWSLQEAWKWLAELTDWHSYNMYTIIIWGDEYCALWQLRHWNEREKRAVRLSPDCFTCLVHNVLTWSCGADEVQIRVHDIVQQMRLHFVNNEKLQREGCDLRKM